MAFCQSCGTAHRDDANFCPKCGVSTATAGTTAAVAAPAEPDPDVTRPITASTGPTTPGPTPATPAAPAADAPPPRAIGGVGTALTVLFLLAGIASVAGAVASFDAASDVRTILDDDGSFLDNFAIANDASDQVGVVTALWVLLAIPILILLVIWTHRAQRNVRTFGAHDPRLPDGLAAGGWFIPLFWYVGPYLSISDSFKGSSPDPNDRRRSGFVLVWWATFCAANIAYLIGNNLATSDSGVSVSFGETDVERAIEISEIVEDPDKFAAGWNVVGAAFSISTLSAVLAIFAIRAVGARHAERIAEWRTMNGAL